MLYTLRYNSSVSTQHGGATHIMLSEQFNKNYKQRDNLSQATARALALGNDITARGARDGRDGGYTVQSMEDTIRTYTNVPAMTPQRAVYNTEQALCNSGLCDVTWKPRKRLSDTFVHSLQNRVIFWECYRKLRASGMTRRMIINTIRNI